MSNTYEKYSEVYKRNAEKMEMYKAMSEAARKRGDMETARKYRTMYSDLKAEIDTLVFQIIGK